MKNHIIVILFTLLSNTIFSCICVQLPISEDKLKNYNVVFYGKVDSVSTTDSIKYGNVFFTIKELYKGEVTQHIELEFDSSTDCLMSFSKGEEWIIYSSYQRFDELRIVLCGNSRKHFTDIQHDYNLIFAERTFEEEKEYLKEVLSIQPFKISPEIINQQNNFGPRNTLPTNSNKLWLLSCSFLIMVIVYFITRKKDKKND